MAEHIDTEIAIDAPPARVWQVLTDFASYPAWNPFILEVQGAVRLDATVPYRFEFPRGIRLWAKARILRLEPEQELRWAAFFLTPRLFNGEHYFRIKPASGARSVFQHGETFTGVAVPVAWPVVRSYGPDIYQSLNAALKQRVEASPS